MIAMANHSTNPLDALFPGLGRPKVEAPPLPPPAGTPSADGATPTRRRVFVRDVSSLRPPPPPPPPPTVVEPIRTEAMKAFGRERIEVPTFGKPPSPQVTAAAKVAASNSVRLRVSSALGFGSVRRAGFDAAPRPAPVEAPAAGSFMYRVQVRAAAAAREFEFFVRASNLVEVAGLGVPRIGVWMGRAHPGMSWRVRAVERWEEEIAYG